MQRLPLAGEKKDYPPFLPFAIKWMFREKLIVKDRVVYFQKDKITGEILYIGSGSKSRATQMKSTKLWEEIVKNNPNGFITEIIKEGLTVTESKDLEQELLDKYKPRANTLKTVSKEIEHNINLSEFVYYNETSPTFLSWKVDKFSGRNYTVHDKRIGTPAGSYKENQYSSVYISGQMLRTHRVIWELFNGKIPLRMVIDHIDGNKNNNNISNLRLLTHSQNSMNRSYKEMVLWPGLYFTKTSIAAVLSRNQFIFFSMKDYGVIPATAMAIRKRQEYLLSLEDLAYTNRQNAQLLSLENLKLPISNYVVNPLGDGISFSEKTKGYSTYAFAIPPGNSTNRKYFNINSWGLIPATAAALQFKLNGFCDKEDDLDYSPKESITKNLVFTTKKNIDVVLVVRGSKHLKEISIRKHGLLPATMKAIEFRELNK